MEKFAQLDGLVVPLDRANVDTDAIIPKQFLKSVKRSGFGAIIAPSFADIFFNNCFKNGLLPIRLAAEQVDALFKAVEAAPGYRLKIDLERQSITAPDGTVYKFEVEVFRKHCLLNGLDDIGLTLQHVDEIKVYEAKHRAAQPWLFV